jgi:hypothetical protein
LTKIRNIEFLGIMRQSVLASAESARKANRSRLDDRAAIYRALNGIGIAADNRRRSLDKLLGAERAIPRRGQSTDGSAAEAARRRAGIARRLLGGLARIRPITAVTFADKGEKPAIVYRRGTHHAEHVDGATNRARCRLGALGVGLKHAGCVHGPLRLFEAQKYANHLIVNRLVLTKHQSYLGRNARITLPSSGKIFLARCFQSTPDFGGKSDFRLA